MMFSNWPVGFELQRHFEQKEKKILGHFEEIESIMVVHIVDKCVHICYYFCIY